MKELKALIGDYVLVIATALLVSKLREIDWQFTALPALIILNMGHSAKAKANGPRMKMVGDLLGFVAFLWPSIVWWLM